MSTNPVVQPGERRLKIRQAMRRTVVGRTLYNAADIPVKFTHDGVRYTIPPDGPWHERFTDRISNGSLLCSPGIVDDRGEHVLYDGTLTVYDRYGVTPEKASLYRKALRRGGRPVVPDADKLLAGADIIAQHAINKRGPFGVTFLVNYPETTPEDEAEKVRAKADHLAWKKDSVARTLKNFRDRTAAFHSDPRNSGAMAPQMDAHELAAERWQNEYDLGMKNTKAFPCPQNCGFADNDVEITKRHFQVRHSLLAWPGYAEELAEVEDAKVPARKARR